MEAHKKGLVFLPNGTYFNFEDHNLHSSEGEILKSDLQGYEYDVFYCLANNYPNPQSIDRLISLIWEKRIPPISPDPSRVRQVIGEIRAFLDDRKKPYQYIIYVKKSTYSDGGYKCCAKLTPPEPPKAEPPKAEPPGDPEGKPMRGNSYPPQRENAEKGEISAAKEIENVIHLSSLLIYKSNIDHPRKEELELEIREIIALLEQGLSADFEEVCERAWESLSLIQKAQQIFRAYEYLTNIARDMSMTDTNARI